MQSVLKMDSTEPGIENAYYPIAVRVWKKTYERLKAMSGTPETSIVRLIDQGVTLLEQKKNDAR